MYLFDKIHDGCHASTEPFTKVDLTTMLPTYITVSTSTRKILTQTMPQSQIQQVPFGQPQATLNQTMHVPLNRTPEMPLSMSTFRSSKSMPHQHHQGLQRALHNLTSGYTNGSNSKVIRPNARKETLPYFYHFINFPLCNPNTTTYPFLLKPWKACFFGYNLVDRRLSILRFDILLFSLGDCDE